MKTVYSSHRDDARGGDKAPITAHMATGPIDDLTPIPRGAYLYFIEDPTRADTIIQCIVDKVTFKDHKLATIRLVAFSKSWKTTRVLRLTATWEGKHVSGLDEEQKQVDKVLEKQGIKEVHQNNDNIDQKVQDAVRAALAKELAK